MEKKFIGSCVIYIITVVFAFFAPIIEGTFGRFMLFFCVFWPNLTIGLELLIAYFMSKQKEMSPLRRSLNSFTLFYSLGLCFAGVAAIWDYFSYYDYLQVPLMSKYYLLFVSTMSMFGAYIHNHHKLKGSIEVP